MKFFGRKAAPDGARPMFVRPFDAWLTGVGEGPRSYEQRVEEALGRNPVAQRACRIIGDAVAEAPLEASDPAIAALVTASSAGQTLLETAALHLLLHGNAYIQILTNADGGPVELFALRPERVKLEADARGWPIAYRYRAGGGETRLAAEDARGRPAMIHVKAPHPLDDHYGMGALQAASAAVALHNAATRWNRALLDNAARPSGALVYDAGKDGGTLTPTQFERLKAEMAALFQGAGNAGRPLLLEGGLKWQALSLSPADMDFAELKAAAARDIALAFGVPPMLLGLPGDATYANYREAGRALWRLTILPLAGKLLGAIGQHLRPWYAGGWIRVAQDRLPALAEDRERLWAQVNAADFLSDDEKRALLGLTAPAGD